MTDYILSAMVLEIAHLIAGLLLCFVGRDLIIKGVSADFIGEGEVSGKKLRILTASPGLIFLISGLAIVISSVLSQNDFLEQTGDNIKHARFVSSQTQPEILPPPTQPKDVVDNTKARVLFASLSIHLAASPEQVTTADPDRIRAEIEKTRNQSDHSILKTNLVASLRRDPVGLLLVLNDNKYAWILQDDDIMETLIHQTEELLRSHTSVKQ